MPDSFVKSLIVPSIRVRSSTSKVVDASLRVNVIVAVSPAFKAVMSLVIATVGRTVSTAIGVASEPARFGLPSVSANAPTPTEMVPGVSESVAGVNTAV